MSKEKPRDTMQRERTNNEIIHATKYKIMETFKNAIAGSQLTLVDFYATWCGPCKAMHPVLEQLKEDLGEDLRILKIDVDKNEAAAAEMRIQAVPTLMLFRNGEQLWRQSGALSKNDLLAVIKPFLNK